MQDFPETLKSARKAAGLTQKNMAATMLIPIRTIEDWERGQASPSVYIQVLVLNKLNQIANAKGDNHENH